jgi:hypothetical protein
VLGSLSAAPSKTWSHWPVSATASLRDRDVIVLGSSLFAKAAELRVPAPTTGKELATLLEKHMYYERDIEAEEHFVHVETDDDEVELEYFFFDDYFLREPDALDRLPKAGRRTDRYSKFLQELADTKE